MLLLRVFYLNVTNFSAFVMSSIDVMYLYSNWSSSCRVSSFKKEKEVAEIKIVLNLYEQEKFYLYPWELADREKRKIVNIIKKN